MAVSFPISRSIKNMTARGVAQERRSNRIFKEDRKRDREKERKREKEKEKEREKDRRQCRRILKRVKIRRKDNIDTR
ncbi:hypothetical protein HZH68_011134 [Vespula germanica]|uniref:Uncharacterized protein n=1 Tax=Vespula germanica TaxID=30212 RepID=A0A834JU59_VESGE|nr:hypothetical protein HZH68_011134 [Vespula germanica]